MFKTIKRYLKKESTVLNVPKMEAPSTKVQKPINKLPNLKITIIKPYIHFKPSFVLYAAPERQIERLN